MKVMPNNKREGLRVKTNLTPGNNTAGVKAQEPIGLDGVQEHLERLREVSTVAAKLFSLLGDQITLVSSTAPIQRGYKTVEELAGQAKTHRDALATAFDPLREQIEKLKNGFWENHGDTIRANIKNHVERKVKEKVAVEVEKAIERYRDHLANNEQNNKGLLTTMGISRARADNSLLNSKHLNERVTWIGNTGPVISLGELVLADGVHVDLLAKSLDLPPGGEDAQVPTLNVIFRHLGVQYRAIPSRATILLMPNATSF